RFGTDRILKYASFNGCRDARRNGRTMPGSSNRHRAQAVGLTCARRSRGPSRCVRPQSPASARASAGRRDLAAQSSSALQRALLHPPTLSRVPHSLPAATQRTRPFRL
ncbi:unnamed protein product, partial [Mycena citricolor]